MDDTLLRFPRDLLRLLYWIYFKPFTLRRYARRLDTRLDQDLSLWEARDRLDADPALRDLERLVLGLLLVAPPGSAVLAGLAWTAAGQTFDWATALTYAGGFSLGAQLDAAWRQRYQTNILVHGLVAVGLFLALNAGLYAAAISAGAPAEIAAA